MALRYYIPLTGTAGTAGVRLRELDGHAEIDAVDPGTPAVLEWLNELMDGSPPRAEELAVPDRDRLLAAIYYREFGDRIESTITCGGCGKPFDFGFSLEGLRRHLGEPAASADGTYRLADGARFRLPTGADELAIESLPAERRERGLLERCMVGGMLADAAELEAALSGVAPLLSTELVAKCVECGTEQTLLFDIQSLLFLRLAHERRELARQVHLLASTYRWSREEILSLSRLERRAYSAMIESERK
jgi:hypothetical protein